MDAEGTELAETKAEELRGTKRENATSEDEASAKTEALPEAPLGLGDGEITEAEGIADVGANTGFGLTPAVASDGSCLAEDGREAEGGWAVATPATRALAHDPSSVQTPAAPVHHNLGLRRYCMQIVGLNAPPGVSLNDHHLAVHR